MTELGHIIEKLAQAERERDEARDEAKRYREALETALSWIPPIGDVPREDVQGYAAEVGGAYELLEDLDKAAEARAALDGAGS